ncbi:MAG: hypothetical protein ACRDHE_12195, partial [Ktedonobacterales bacterium]
MRTKLTLPLLVLAPLVAAALALAPAATASGPIYSLQGGSGVVFGGTRYVPVGDSAGVSTQLLSISAK